jgi:hypothetical protein
MIAHTFRTNGAWRTTAMRSVYLQRHLRFRMELPSILPCRSHLAGEPHVLQYHFDHPGIRSIGNIDLCAVHSYGAMLPRSRLAAFPQTQSDFPLELFCGSLITQRIPCAADSNKFSH